MKSKLVLTGRVFTNPTFPACGKEFRDGLVHLPPAYSYCGMRDFLVIGMDCYEYRVQYQTDTKAQ